MVGVMIVLLGGSWLFVHGARLGLAAVQTAVIADPIARVMLLGRGWCNGAWRRAPQIASHAELSIPPSKTGPAEQGSPRFETELISPSSRNKIVLRVRQLL